MNGAPRRAEATAWFPPARPSATSLGANHAPLLKLHCPAILDDAAFSPRKRRRTADHAKLAPHPGGERGRTAPPPAGCSAASAFGTAALREAQVRCHHLAGDVAGTHGFTRSRVGCPC